LGHEGEAGGAVPAGAAAGPRLCGPADHAPAAAGTGVPRPGPLRPHPLPLRLPAPALLAAPALHPPYHVARPARHAPFEAAVPRVPGGASRLDLGRPARAAAL